MGIVLIDRPDCIRGGNCSAREMVSSIWVVLIKVYLPVWSVARCFFLLITIIFSSCMVLFHAAAQSALMFWWAACKAHLYLKVVTARVQVVFKCFVTYPYVDGTVIIHGHPSHFSIWGGINPGKPHTQSARVLTMYGIELGKFRMLGHCTYQLSYASIPIAFTY